MLKFVCLLCLLTVAQTAHLQQNWKLNWQIQMDSTAIWDISNLNQAFIYQNQNIQKLDINGKMMLQESFKSIGIIEKIDALNPLKIILFSEDQQTICYLDNALALQGDCINLSDQNINLATSISSSSQTDRIWIYDEPNARITLITLRSNQSQLVQNITGLLDLKTIVNIQETGNKLFVYDNSNQVAWFDIFGNFMDASSFSSKVIYPIEDLFLVASNKEIYLVDLLDEEKKQLFFQGEGFLDGDIQKMKVVGSTLYIQTKSQFYCFQLEKV
ncbi:MAG TPA: hypothetical protein PLI97_02700 [Fluviicola sp.]|nr:hypothetical protein [Fluviicola sp.]